MISDILFAAPKSIKFFDGITPATPLLSLAHTYSFILYSLPSIKGDYPVATPLDSNEQVKAQYQSKGQ